MKPYLPYLFNTFILIFGLSSTVLAQKTSLDQFVQLSPGNKSIEQILQEITAQKQLFFSYNPQQIPLDKEIKLNGEKSTLRTLLKFIFANEPLQILAQDNLIIIKRIQDHRKEAASNNKYTISGYIRDAQTNESLIGAILYVPETSQGITTNAYGFYSITLPAGNYSLAFSYLGFETKVLNLNLQSNQKIDQNLESTATTLPEMIFTDYEEKKRNIWRPSTGEHQMDMDLLESLSTFTGETDLIKTLQMIPGVKTITEGSSGMFVRGGRIDQNLILLDEAPIYNPGHMLGFFSAFNTSALKDVTLNKGSIPAEYGGRLSSLLSIQMREGNAQKFQVTGGISLLSARISLEGPIVKEKSSFIVSARRTYLDYLLSSDTENDDLRLFFSDFNAKLNVKINRRNHIYLSTYLSRDEEGNADNIYSWGNRTATLRWNHLFSPKVFSNFTLVYSRYRYFLNLPRQGPLAIWNSFIQDYTLKLDLTYFPNPKNTLKWGGQVTYHRINPGQNIQADLRVPRGNALEYALYIGNEQEVNDRLSLNYGLRFSLFQNLGKSTLYRYDDNFQVVDTTFFPKIRVYNTYAGFEPRFTLRYSINHISSIKGSFTHTRQYLQLIDNSTLSLSNFNIWLPSNPNLRPQSANQITIGYFRNIHKNQFEFSLEAYFKRTRNHYDYKDHARLVQNPFLEGELRPGKATAYGLEFLINKRIGRWKGWISYVWSRIWIKVPTLNDGRRYPASHDRPHDFNIVMSYDTRKRWSFSLNWVYMSGNAITLPSGTFRFANRSVPIFTEKNGSRLAPFHRLNLSATLRPKRKPHKKRWLQGTWTFSIYNAYFRLNPSLAYIDTGRNFLFFEIDNEILTGKQVFLLGIIPSVTYSFKF